MTDGRIPRLAALVREAAAVLAAILIAFALDAWWDAHVERSQMLAALDAVASETRRNLEVVDSTRRYNAAQAALVERALALGSGDFSAMSDDEVAEFRDLPDFLIGTLELGATAAFIQGGFLASVDDPGLRVAIAGIPALQVELDEEAATVFSASEEVNRRFLGLVPVDEALALGGVTTPAAMRAYLVAMANDEAVRTALYGRTTLLMLLYDAELALTHERLEALAARLDEALGRR